MSIEAIRKKLARLRRLETDWAGWAEKGGFPAPAGAVIAWAEALLLRGELGELEGLRCYPLSTGGVEIIWNAGVGDEQLEITIEIEAVTDE